MDHIQKEPPLNLKGITGASEGSECGLVPKADIKTEREISASPLSRTWEPFFSEFITFHRVPPGTWMGCVCDYDGKRVRQ